MPALPNVVIAGVTKAGTTSLFHYLGQHPDVGAAAVKEVDHYAAMVHGEPPPPLADYAAHFARCADAPWRLEASPRYFIGGPELVDRLATDLDRPRVLITLREPVQRTWSSYTYKRSKNVLPARFAFDDFVERCRQVADDGAVRDPTQAAYRTLATGRYADFLGDWITGFGTDLRVVFFDDLAARPADTVAGVLRWLGADPAPTADFDLGRRNATVSPRSQALRRAALRVNARLGGSDTALTRALRSGYRRLNSGTFDEQLGEAQRAELSDWYAPSVAALREQLRAHGTVDLPGWLTGQTGPIASSAPGSSAR